MYWKMSSGSAVSVFALVSLLLWAQVPESSAVLPQPIPPRAIAVDGGVCPTTELRDTELASIDNDIRNILQESVISPCGLGWTRVIFLNATDPSMPCPSAWEQLNNPSVPELDGCGRHSSDGASCDSVAFPTGVEYSQVCGRIIAHQYAATDGFGAFFVNQPTIDDPYVDGVSVTYGSPRSHIWTFAVSVGDTSSEPLNLCPCDPGSTAVPPSYVGDDYFCEAGRQSHSYEFGTDALWDGLDCAVGSTCCDAPPWFTTTLPAPTTDDIEIRVCGDEATINENLYMELVEIYVK